MLPRKLVVKLKARDDAAAANHHHQAAQQEQLREAVQAIQSSRETPATLEELFR